MIYRGLGYPFRFVFTVTITSQITSLTAVYSIVYSGVVKENSKTSQICRNQYKKVQDGVVSLSEILQFNSVNLDSGNGSLPVDNKFT